MKRPLVLAVVGASLLLAAVLLVRRPPRVDPVVAGPDAFPETHVRDARLPDLSARAEMPREWTYAPGTVCTVSGWCWEHPLPQGNTLRAVWGTAKNDVWAVGDHGTILRFDGSVWRGIPSGTLDDLVAVQGRSRDHVWILGARNALLEWRDGALYRWVAAAGGSRRQAVAPDPNPAPVRGPQIWRDLWVEPNGEVFAAGGERGLLGGPGRDEETSRHAALGHFDGTTWNEFHDHEASPLDVVVADRGRVTAFGPGLAFSWTGKAWKKLSAAAAARDRDLSAAMELGVRPDVVGFMRADGEFVPHTDHPAPTALPTVPIRAVLDLAPDDRWAVGDGGAMFHFDGSRWSGHGLGDDGAVALWSHQRASLLGVWADVGGAAVAVGGDMGGGVMLARSAGGWRAVPVPEGQFSLPSLTAVSGRDPRDVIAVGDLGAVFRYDGKTLRRDGLRPDGSTSSHLTDVLSLGPDDVWVAGRDGTWHFDGSRWIRHAPATGWRSVPSLVGVPGEVWAFPPLARFVHGAWKAGPALEASEAGLIARLAPDDVVVYARGAMWRSRRGTAVRLAEPADVLPRDMEGSDGELWVAGEKIGRFSADAWAIEDPGTRQLLRIRLTKDAVWGVGERLAIMRRPRP